MSVDYHQKYLQLTEHHLREISKLECLLVSIQADLLMRGEKDSEGISVVNLSNSIWQRLKDVTVDCEFQEKE